MLKKIIYRKVIGIWAGLLVCFALAVCLPASAETYVAQPKFTTASPTEAVAVNYTLTQDPTTGEWKTYQAGQEVPYSGIVENAFGTWYCMDGKVDFNYNGVVSSNGEKWIIQSGKLASEYAGQLTDNFFTYDVTAGHVDKKSLSSQTITALLLLALLLGAIIISVLRKKKTKTKKALSQSIVDETVTAQEPEMKKVKVVAKQNDPSEKTEDETNTSLPYRRKLLLTPNEYKFYKSLKPIADSLGLVVLSKVRMGDLVEPLPNWTDRSKWWSDWGRVKTRHVDFALVKPSNMYVELLIELDDASHNNQKARETDQFKNDVYKSTGYKLLRVKNDYQLEEKIREKLAE